MAEAASSPALKWIEAPQFGKAYHLAENLMTLQDGKRYCSALGGRLLLPLSKEENAFLCDSFPSLHMAWLDISNDGSFKQKRFNGELITYSNWLIHPTYPHGIMFMAGSSRGFWDGHDHPDALYNVICERNYAIKKLLKAHRRNLNKQCISDENTEIESFARDKSMAKRMSDLRLN